METKLIELIGEQFGIPTSEINLAMELRKDLNATDLELADFFQSVEDTFKIVISKNDALKLATIEDLILYVSDHAEEIT